MIKVCHMTSAHAPEDDRIFHKECVSLKKAGYDVYLVEQGDTYEKNGVHIIGIGNVNGGRLKRIFRVTKNIYQRALEIDAEIYHFHDPELIPYGLKLRRKGKKVIFDSHEKYTEQMKDKPYLPKWVSRWIAKCYGIYERHALKQLDAVIFPCTMDGKNPFKGQCKRSAIISNAAILGEFFDRYSPEYPKKEDMVCYIGGLTEERGITNDIKAAYRAGATLALAGPFSSEEYEASLREMAEYSCVEYRGQLNRESVAALLSESCIGLCTLLNRGQYLKIDTFGIKVFEYMSLGLPVILSDSPYNQRMIKQYQIGICVNPENVDEIATAIRYLLDTPEEAKRMGDNGRRAIKKEFNWGVEEKKLFALYEDILESRRD